MLTLLADRNVLTQVENIVRIRILSPVTLNRKKNNQ